MPGLCSSWFGVAMTLTRLRVAQLWDNIIAHNLNTSYNMSYGIIALSGAITLGAAFVECDA